MVRIALRRHFYVVKDRDLLFGQSGGDELLAHFRAILCSLQYYMLQVSASHEYENPIISHV
jgi:hypothetical protein